jgi:hypothetical protein
MSGRNGDKARHDRETKKKILRNQRTRELQKRLSLKNQGAQAASAESK